MTDSRLEGEKANATGGGGGSGDAQTQTSSASAWSNHREPPPGYTPSYTYTAALAIPAVLSSQVPPSGSRILLSSRGGPAFPDMERARGAPFTDLDKSPVFIGSAFLKHSVHPCKIVLNNDRRRCYVPYDGREITHDGLYDLLPFVPEHMEFVPTSGGQIPPGRHPVKGGFESDGQELYHAVALIAGIEVPGKASSHLNGCRVPYDGREHVVSNNYRILCWKF
ncbi:hypothetical protein BC827DRAFT_1205501 [Russula dissimulans]|nr:hypothetical protein BC827DRAFT_1205501 [Russula dissimulans]